MPFEKSKCTSELLKEISAPPALEKEIGETCIVERSKKVALFTHPFDHSTYPDQSFTLVIDGQVFRVWEIVVSTYDDCRVEVYVSKETEHFEDSALISLVRSAFSVLRSADASTLPVLVKNRTLPPEPPRDPEKIIAVLNKFHNLMPQGMEASYFLRHFFVPILVRPTELEILVAYGRETAWSGLEPEAKELFRETLERLENAN